MRQGEEERGTENHLWLVSVVAKNTVRNVCGACPRRMVVLVLWLR